VLGHPIISGEEFLALSQDDMFVRWRPRTTGAFLTVAHPFPGTPEPDLTPVATFGGYPLALTSYGTVIADDHVSPFISVFAPSMRALWHEDMMNRIGVPAVQQDVIFTNVGGTNALDAIAALNAKDGSPLWQYAPQGFEDEPITIIQREKQRGTTVAERASIEALRKSYAARGLSGAGMPSSDRITIKQSAPGIDAAPGHWLNPGLVTVADTVYGEVRGSIVALNQATGAVAWSYPLTQGMAHSIAASQDHLFVSCGTELIALNLKTGKLEWSQATARAGTLSIANGRVILAMGAMNSGTPEGGEILVFGHKEEQDKPAEIPPLQIPPPLARW
jgi:outer membrane protein assembly factor BamB